MEKEQAAHGLEARLGPELMAEVCRALNFDPAEFARRHAEEFTHQYLRLDGMLSYVGEEIVVYLAPRINECLSKAEYALLSYIEYAGREPRKEESDCFGQAVANYLKARREVGSPTSGPIPNESSWDPGAARKYPRRPLSNNEIFPAKSPCILTDFMIESAGARLVRNICNHGRGKEKSKPCPMEFPWIGWMRSSTATAARCTT